MITGSRFLKFCREVEELKFTFVLFPYTAFSSKPKHSINDASEVEDLLLESIRSVTRSRIFVQKTHQICTTEDVLPDRIGSKSISDTQQRDERSSTPEPR
jgi:hypothetical protein